MAATDTNVIRVPYEDPIAEKSGIVTRSWQSLFRLIKTLLDPLGTEKTFQLVNNLGVAADIEGMALSKAQISHGIIEYLVQRVTTGGGATEIVTGGMFHLVYKPTSLSWAIQAIGTAGPSASGITFSITADGQVQYTSSNITGTASISRIIFRIRTLAAKNSQYSDPGSR